MFHEDDGESPWSSDHCGLVKDDKHFQYCTPYKTIITPLNKLPDWCPLEEKTNEN